METVLTELGPEWDGHLIFGDLFDCDDAYRTSRPQGMKDWLIVYTLAGEGYFRTPSGERRCGEGQAALLRAGVPHEYGTVTGGHWTFLWIHYPGLPENGYLPDEEVWIEHLPGGALRERVERAFRRVLQDSRDRFGLWQQLCENSLREILLLLARRMSRRLDSRIEHTLQLLSHSMKQEIRMDALARQVGLSVSRLSHLFKQETGQTVVEYLNRMRVRQAAMLMERQGRHASEAALDVGYQNYNHFAEQFVKYIGVSPRAYRQALNGRDE
ncbi:helix-turn-helix domain-containing protein [Cohnella lubricantis]|uniref:Helix-turn-helix domain-containing protein n=1 Tax=Cohnella lubricantis TaxID=2163172 RepID=A0A841T9M0_9BACL|nr:helix-turn-helix domain-containing protein [Cohnella lubricantis]MBB6675737.1 helix-turn-helix domain-containing protein [Cohnella lubricantis]MBP2118881.1 AraC family transcriptional regulator of arabinose operon [Cohnella lubricantis]